MVRVLAENDDFDILDRCQLKGFENLRAGREYHLPFRLFPMELAGQRGEIGLLKLGFERFFPTLLYLDIHIRIFL